MRAMATGNPDYTNFVATLNCRMGMHDPCDGMIVVHRTQSEDESAIPLCRKHREALATARVPFKTMGADGRRRWELVQVKWTRSQWIRAS